MIELLNYELIHVIDMVHVPYNARYTSCFLQLLSVNAAVLGNLCVAYVMNSQTEDVSSGNMYIHVHIYI